jgi:hypothetical protein
MRYSDFKSVIHSGLLAHPAGMTWKQLKTDFRLPYDHPCPEWTRRLEQDIHLVRRKGAGTALIWALKPNRNR